MKSICKTDKYGKYWVIPNSEKYNLSYNGLGVLHREDGPAIEYNDGEKHWHINGEWHREDGPAIEYSKSGHIYWYLHNIEIEPTIEIMEKYIRLNPDNILKNYYYPLEIQILAISLKPSVIFNIKYPDDILEELYPKLFALKNSGLI